MSICKSVHDDINYALLYADGSIFWNIDMAKRTYELQELGKGCVYLDVVCIPEDVYDAILTNSSKLILSKLWTYVDGETGKITVKKCQLGRVESFSINTHTDPSGNNEDMSFKIYIKYKAEN